ncbi:MAG: hypothetical protein U1B30_16400 [Pseudomonadota bacterium]|nr:hypothetical protein [Pseudomonadota bacterium]
MDVENLSLSQWLNALKISHFSALVAFIISVGVAGFFLGSLHVDAIVLNSTAELREKNDSLLKINGEWAEAGEAWEGKFTELNERIGKWQVHAEDLKKLLSIERSRVEVLQQREANLNSCEFTQIQIENITEEIKAKKKQIDDWPDKYADTNPVYIANLESRLNSFQKSLQSCNLQGL